MKRLTKTYQDGSYGVADDLDVAENSYEFKNLLVDRLGSFEDPMTPDKELKSAWGVPISYYNINYDISVLSEFVRAERVPNMHAHQMQAMARLQLEIYNLLLQQRVVTNNYVVVNTTGEEDEH